MRIFIGAWEDPEMKNMAWVAGLVAAVIGGSAAVAAHYCERRPS
jgi:hypothetical protein